jgi:hypothetical protein
MRLFTVLDLEWQAVGASAEAADAVRRWAVEDAPLVSFSDLRDVVQFVQHGGRSERSDEVVACVAKRARLDALAARALLQVVLYGLIRIAVDFRPATYSDDEVASVVVAAAYERIRTYPIDRRPRSVIANVLLDTRHRVSRTLCPATTPEILVDNLLPDDHGRPEMSAAEELLALVDAAVRAGRLRRDDAELIVLTRIADVPTEQLAAQRGCPPHSLRRRRLRAEASLAAASLRVA